jgi:hypothetical protein
VVVVHGEPVAADHGVLAGVAPAWRRSFQAGRQPGRRLPAAHQKPASRMPLFALSATEERSTFPRGSRVITLPLVARTGEAQAAGHHLAVDLAAAVKDTAAGGRPVRHGEEREPGVALNRRLRAWRLLSRGDRNETARVWTPSTIPRTWIERHSA